MFSEAQLTQLASELDQSARTRQQLTHFSQRFPGMSVDDGYRISRAWVQMQITNGSQVIGHKIGLTSRAMQVSSQIEEPDYGTLLDHMLYTAKPGEVLDIPAHNFIVPRVEVELAFVLHKPLIGPGLPGGKEIGLQDVLDATQYVTPAIEIIDSRIEQFDRTTKEPLDDATMKQIVAEGDKRGLILGVHNNRIHVTPPCVISADEATQGVEILDQVLTATGC